MHRGRQISLRELRHVRRVGQGWFSLTDRDESFCRKMPPPVERFLNIQKNFYILLFPVPPYQNLSIVLGSYLWGSSFYQGIREITPYNPIEND
jgi:hypothetical protein